MPWTIARNAVNQEVYAHIQCDRCKQSMSGTNPDMTLRHCGGKVEFLTIAQREALAAGSAASVAAAMQEQGRANFASLEAAANVKLQPRFNEAAAFEREVAQMRRDAGALEAKRREQYEYDLRTPLPRQPTGETPQREQYLPGVKDV